MKRWAFLLAATMLISGCSDDSGDSGPSCEADQFVEDGECMDHVEPTMVVTGIPATLDQFASVEVAWTLDNGTRTAVHSMDNRILASMEDMAVTNVTGPDDWGTQLHKETHKDFPYSSTADISWDEIGTLYLKGYMDIGGHVWVDLGTIEITEVSATGNRTTITVEGTPADVDDSEVTVTVGDGVTFDNQAGYDLSIVWACTEAAPDDGDIPADETLSFDFTTLTSCDYTLYSPIGGVDPENDPGAIEGKIVVARP